jgi:hypothetical protein
LGATNVDELENFETEKLLNSAAIGEGIAFTGLLKTVKYNEVISVPEKRKKAIVKEHDMIIQNAVWIPIKLNNLPSNIKPLSTT